MVWGEIGWSAEPLTRIARHGVCVCQSGCSRCNRGVPVGAREGDKERTLCHSVARVCCARPCADLSTRRPGRRRRRPPSCARCSSPLLRPLPATWRGCGRRSQKRRRRSRTGTTASWQRWRTSSSTSCRGTSSRCPGAAVKEVLSSGRCQKAGCSSSPRCRDKWVSAGCFSSRLSGAVCAEGALHPAKRVKWIWRQQGFCA